MWIRALRVIPRIERAEFERLDVVARWLIAARGAVLVMTFFSALIAGLLAALVGPIDVPLLALTALGLVVIHGSSNLLNDYWDAKLGVDEGNYFRAQYGPHPLLSGLFTEKKLLAWITATTMLAVVIGLYLTMIRGPWVLAFAAVGFLIMLLYAGKPLPLKYFGLGEPAVFITWGPLMIGGTYFVLRGDLPAWILIASLPYTLGVTLVLFGKHIDKIEDDTRKRIRTVPVILGGPLARNVSIALMILMYIITTALLITGFLAITLLLVFFAVPQALQMYHAFRKPRPAEPPEGYDRTAWPIWFVGFAFVHNRRFGGMFVLGLALDLALRLFGVTATIPTILG
jgi:1,4-dihydroxy-2-naphthoate octaprenyltransferase